MFDDHLVTLVRVTSTQSAASSDVFNDVAVCKAKEVATVFVDLGPSSRSRGHRSCANA